MEHKKTPQKLSLRDSLPEPVGVDGTYMVSPVLYICVQNFKKLSAKTMTEFTTPVT